MAVRIGSVPQGAYNRDNPAMPPHPQPHVPHPSPFHPFHPPVPTRIHAIPRGTPPKRVYLRTALHPSSSGSGPWGTGGGCYGDIAGHEKGDGVSASKNWKTCVLRIPPKWNEYIPKKNRHSESVPKGGWSVQWGERHGRTALTVGPKQNPFSGKMAVDGGEREGR
jgi:hypothetical protein